MSNTLLLTLLAAALLLSALAGASLAGNLPGDVVVYSTLGPGNSYSYGAGWTVQNQTPSGYTGRYYEPADAFTPSVTVNFDEIDLPLGTFGGSAGIEVSICADNSGVPGAVLADLTASNLAGFPGNPLTDLAEPSGGTHPLLVAGTRYWVTATGDPGMLGAWNNSSPEVDGLHGECSDYGATWSTFTTVQGAFQVQGTPVPEPSSPALLAAGVGLMGCAWRRRGAARRGRIAGGGD